MQILFKYQISATINIDELMHMCLGSLKNSFHCVIFQYNKEITTMTNIYGAARICPYDNQACDIATEGVRLEPGTKTKVDVYFNFWMNLFWSSSIKKNIMFTVTDAEKVMAESRDYEELKYVWSQWRDASGAKMRNNYKNYVTLSNQAAEANGKNLFP